jgi:hypothetical protein
VQQKQCRSLGTLSVYGSSLNSTVWELKCIRPGKKQEIPQVTEWRFCKPQNSKSCGTASRRFCTCVIRLSWPRSTMKVHEQIIQCSAALASNGSVEMPNGRKHSPPASAFSWSVRSRFAGPHSPIWPTPLKRIETLRLKCDNHCRGKKPLLCHLDGQKNH